ncbi:MAG: lamin tail domain-containing protein, partial [Bacteroidia bacterium]|nr:lamin tail domain-containing protein [Bacteroidia bacterium]
MKKVILLALLMPYMAFGQIVENFESGSIVNWVQSSEGRWKADTIESISGRFSLHHVFDNPDAGTDRIGIPVMNLHPSLGLTRWSFLIRHGYDPSSSNNWSVFLMSDTKPSAMSMDGGTNGFVLGVNLTGYDDTLRLWKVKSNIVNTVIDCRINWQTTIGITGTVKIIVERSQEGYWTVSVYRLNENLIGTSSGTDSEIFSPAWFGIYYKYSSTRDRLLWLDDISIEGNFFEDHEAPVVTSCEASGKNSVEVTFNEEPGTEVLVPGNFSLNTGENKSISVIKKKSLTYLVEFANALNNKSMNNLIISMICDNSGNCAQNIQIPFTLVWAETGDVIISEIMADPLPEVSLPGKEYLEIINRTEYSFNLKNWKLSSEGQNILFPVTTIQPSGIMIICSSQDTSFFTNYGRVMGLKQFPSLTDGGKILCLSDSSGNLIHGVEYSSDWYGDELKSGGGWSLEMIDIRFPFYDEGNWIASASRKGGTPGSINSVSSGNPDISFYGVQNVFPDDSINITVRFTEPVQSLPGNINSIKIGGKDIIDLYPTDPLFRKFSVKVSDPLLRGEVYQLDISGDIKDFAGNGMQKGNFDFGIPGPPESGDILFNELLFNPLPGDPDYIELFNCSEKAIDASRLQLVSVNDGTGDTSQLSPVSSENRCIMPGSYYAITTDKERITARYFSTDTEYLFETGSLPSMADDEGHLILYNRELDRIDEVFYNEEMHDSLLSGYEGIALEKTMPRNTSEEAINWHSASESSGWGTPGAPNFYKDNEAPVVTGCEASGKNSVEVTFNEEPGTELLVPGNFSLNAGENKSISVIKKKSLTYKVKFTNELNNRSLNNLIISRICDNSGNCAQNIQVPFTPVWAETGDVVISEIMADPLPEVSLPGKEYIEITNRTDYSFDLKNWKLTSDDQYVLLPDTKIQPMEIIIICLSKDTSLFTKYGKVTGLKQFPSLTDGGKILCLSDSSGFLIHGVEYSSDWYRDELKAKGGWSLEMIDTRFPFFDEGNWIASTSRKGGTPGYINAVSSWNPDISFYGVKNVFPDDSINITIRFTEPVFNLSDNFRSIRIGGKS